MINNNNEGTKMIRNEFEYKKLNEQGAQATTTIREGFSELLDIVEKLTPSGRSRALAVTKLQEACAWAVRAAAEVPDNQDPA